MDKAINEKALKGIKHFLERRGCEIVEEIDDEKSPFTFVCNDEDGLAFVVTRLRDGSGEATFDNNQPSREEVEMGMARYLSTAEAADLPINTSCRVDVVSLLVLGEQRAMIRLHTNAYGDGE